MSQVTELIPVEVDQREINKHIITGLKDLETLRGQNIRHIICGSLIPAALNGGFYRPIRDIDILVLTKDIEVVKHSLANLGYQGDFIKPPGRLGLKWLEMHKGQIEIALMFGDFDKQGGWRLPLDFGFSLYIPPAALKTTDYEIEGVSFNGPTPESAYLALTQFSRIYANPKREKDLEPFEGKLDKKIIEEIRKSHPGLWFRTYPLPTEGIINLVAGIKDKFISSI